MEEDLIIDLSVAQKDRISVDVNDLREEIEACRSDAAWLELPLSSKIRVLVKERIEELKKASQIEPAEQIKNKGGK